jgi:hypothetical protein
LVYDLETLRMMVKQPIGIYSHVWDAMQIQAPRVVLAETAIDALLLSYADARLAQELMLGVFLDAPAPQVPCSREDGSYNMVAADGSACGTAPPWGYPWLALAWLAALRPDEAWLGRIYRGWPPTWAGGSPSAATTRAGCSTPAAGKRARTTRRALGRSRSAAGTRPARCARPTCTRPSRTPAR